MSLSYVGKNRKTLEWVVKTNPRELPIDNWEIYFIDDHSLITDADLINAAQALREKQRSISGEARQFLFETLDLAKEKQKRRIVRRIRTQSPAMISMLAGLGVINKLSHSNEISLQKMAWNLVPSSEIPKFESKASSSSRGMLSAHELQKNSSGRNVATEAARSSSTDRMHLVKMALGNSRVKAMSLPMRGIGNVAAEK